jgi:hypothetical protein
MQCISCPHDGTASLTRVLCELIDACMQVVTSTIETWTTNRCVALVHRKGHIILQERLNREEQEFCAAVINQHLEKVSRSVEVENDLFTSTHAMV